MVEFSIQNIVFCPEDKKKKEEKKWLRIYVDQPSIDKREDHKLEGATAAFFSPALHDWLSTKQPHHVSCINNTISRGSFMPWNAHVKRLSSNVTRRIPITKNSRINPSYHCQL